MNLDKLLKQLRRDATANPKKAALLGLMLLVALYFWAPLMVKFLPGRASQEENQESLAVAQSFIPATTSTPPVSKTNQFQWQKSRELIRGDQHMKSATFDPTWVDPFGSTATAAESALAANEPKQESTDDSALKAAALIAALEPKDLGITLGGIMIGPRGRLATINGEICRERDVLSIGLKNDKSISLELQVLKITRRSVELGGNGRIFTLELATPTLGAGDQFQTANAK